MIYITDLVREGLRRPLFYVEITAHLQFSFWHRTTAVCCTTTRSHESFVGQYFSVVGICLQQLHVSIKNSVLGMYVLIIAPQEKFV